MGNTPQKLKCTIVDDEFIKTFCGQSVDIYLTMCLVGLFFDRALGL